MTTIIPHLYHRPNKQGLYPIAIRITQNRKSSYVFIGKAIEKNHWDKKNKRVKKNHSNAGRLNAFITKQVADAEKKYLSLELDDKSITAKAIHKEVKAKGKGQLFFEEAKKHIEQLGKVGNFNRMSSEQPIINRFQEFMKGQNVRFQDITIDNLKKYAAYLKGRRKVGDRTIANHLVFIRTLFNRAIANGIVDQKYYPFGKGKYRIKFPQSIKIGLNSEEIKMLEDAKLLDSPKQHNARNLWLFSFYFAGIRVADVLKMKWSDFRDNRLHYRMGKNDKIVSLKIPDKALRIISEYRVLQKHDNDLVFPNLKNIKDVSDKFEVQRQTNLAVRRINEHLKKLAKKLEISKKLTMHIARHSFGNIAGDKISVQMLQKLYRHSSITTTIGYQANFIHKDADEALDDVLNF